MIEEEETKKPEATNPEFLRHDIKIWCLAERNNSIII
jgi:hypothetical protein